MKIVYCDESGDPGLLPKSPQQAFVQSFLYVHSDNWKNCFQAILEKRRSINHQYALPIRLEFHTREFILNKNPYNPLNLNQNTRIKIIEEFLDLIIQLAKMDAKCINVAIIKNRIHEHYSIFDQALMFGLQRIDTNIFKSNEKYRNFILMIDDGYISKTTKITRKLFRFNYVPYKQSTNSRMIKLESIIDDPVAKDSKNSFFIQIADLIAFIILRYIYIKIDLYDNGSKLNKIVSSQTILDWMEKIKPIFNMEACPKSEFNYGIFAHPYQKTN